MKGRGTFYDKSDSAVHVHVSDSRETLCDAENSWLPVDVDNRETWCDDRMRFAGMFT